jgi:hypothetical protein
MLNGQNTFNAGPPGNFPLAGSHGNMQGMQYGMGPGPGSRGPSGMGGNPASAPPPNSQGRFVPGGSMGPGGGGMQGQGQVGGGMGGQGQGQGGLQGGPFNAGPMNGNLGGGAGGLGLAGPPGLTQGSPGPGGRQSMDRTAGKGGVFPRLLTHAPPPQYFPPSRFKIGFNVPNLTPNRPAPPTACDPRVNTFELGPGAEHRVSRHAIKTRLK